MDTLRRRITAFGKAAILGVPPLALGQASAPKTEPYNDPDGRDAWMEKVAARLEAVGNPLKRGKFADRIYYMTDAIGWSPNPGQEMHAAVDVPKGFVTDLTSIPRVFWSLLPTDGPYEYGAIVHDYLYWTQTVPRKEADLIFKYAMEDFKIPAVTIFAIHTAVRLGGMSAWENNADLRRKGEKRVLRILPDKATISWSEWKEKPGVF